MNASNHGPRVAVLDIGTNTLLLLVAERAGGELRAVREECRFGRLGQGLDRTGELDPAAVDRSLAIVREYRAIIDELGVTTTRAVGTQALREAKNSAAFIGPASESLGVAIDIIAGEREAELVYRAVRESFPGLRGSFVIADVGGGSTELIVASPRGVESVTSVPIGSVRMHERHLGSDPPTSEEVAALFADIDAGLSAVELPTAVPLIGSAGTATTIAAVALELVEYDHDRVQGYALPRGAVERQLARYLELSVEARKSLPGMEPQRADVIAAGTAIFARLLGRVDAAELAINGRGVRWGMAYESI